MHSFNYGCYDLLSGRVKRYHTGIQRLAWNTEVFFSCFGFERAE